MGITTSSMKLWTPERYDFLVKSQSVSVYICHFSSKKFCNSRYQSEGVCFPTSLERAVDKRRAEYLAGRMCVSRALSRIGYSVEVFNDANRAPIWPNEIKGSISHSDNFAMAVATDDRSVHGVGIDTEKVMSHQGLEELAGLVLTKKERQLFLVSPDTKLFTLIFSAKESFYKGIYPLVKRYLDFVTMSLEDFDVNTLRFVLEQDIDELYRKGDHVSVYYELMDDDSLFTYFQF